MTFFRLFEGRLGVIDHVNERVCIDPTTSGNGYVSDGVNRLSTEIRQTDSFETPF